MSSPPDSGPSFDPRTWIAPGGKPAAPDAPGAGPAAAPVPPAPVTPADSAPTSPSSPETTSFDPRTWGRTSGQAGAASSAPAGPATTAKAGAGKDGSGKDGPPSPVSRRGLLLAGGGGLVVVGSGAALLTLTGHRTATPHPASASAAAAPPPPDPTGLAAGSAERRSLAIQAPSDLPRALTGNGVSDAEAQAASAAALAGLGQSPGVLHLVLIVAPSGPALRLVSLEARRADNSGVAVARGPGGAFVARPLAAHLTSGVRVIRSEMDANSFYTSAVAAGVPDTLITPFSNAFTFDFDFQREITQGDVFEAAFAQQVNDQGEVSGAPDLLYVSMQTAEKSRALYRFKAGQAEAGWFDGNGRSVVRSFMRTPVEGARVSSTFGMRVHPVLGFVKMHKGVDFAAPIGTPIYAASDGLVEWAAMKGPNGNLVILKHDNGWETYYLHMVRIADGMAPGVRVRQGQQIGQVGMTGRATGPHLHYEVHINSEAVDPMKIPVEQGVVLAGADLKAFFKERDRIDTLRQAQNG